MGCAMAIKIRIKLIGIKWQNEVIDKFGVLWLMSAGCLPVLSFFGVRRLMREIPKLVRPIF
jgi:hypothetical protein